MHLRLSETLEHEVVGELRLIDGRLRHAPWGRLLLESLSEAEVEPILERLRQHGLLARVQRPLSLKRGSATRGLVELVIRDNKRGDFSADYCLQVSHESIFALYERRFWVGTKLQADVMGLYVEGLRALRGATVEPAFASLARLDTLEERLDDAVDHALAGQFSAEKMAALVQELRRAVRLLPWTRRQTLGMRWLPPPSEGLPVESQDARLRIVALDEADGRLEHDQSYARQQAEEPEQFHRRLGETYTSLCATYCPPDGTCIAARASSATALFKHFPRYKPPFGEPPEE